jgi:serine/threonine protein kinase
MAIESAHSLVEAIRELALLDAARMEQLSVELAERFPQPRELGRVLIQDKWLTAFQVNQILLGKGPQLLLGPYVVLDRLGAGGMGEVFKVRHRGLQRVAALKVIGKQHAGSAGALERFRREAEAAAQLSHPNIVAVHDAGEQDDLLYLAMELIHGIDLGRLVLESGPLPVPLACDFIRQASLGLHHAHEKGFVHRDIKPANLLVAPRNGLPRSGRIDIDGLAGATVKILDMGLVRFQMEQHDESEIALTQKGLVLGTLDYLSPEQAMNSHRVDRRADLYSLGCTLYTLLTGQPPFAGGEALNKLLRHQNDPPPPLSRLRPDVPESLQVIVSRLLAKRPEDRFQTADELARTLVDLRDQEPAALAIPVVLPLDLPSDVDMATQATLPDILAMTPPPLPRPRPRRPKRRRRWWWLAGAVVVLGLVAGLSVRFLVWPASPPQTRPSPPEPRPVVVDHLAGYIPPDSAVVLAVRPGQMHRASIFGEPEIPRRLLRGDPVLTGLLDRLGIDLGREVDWLRVHVPAGKPEQTEWLVRRSSVPRAGNKEDAEVLQQGRSLFLATHGPYLLASADRERVGAGREAAGKGNPAVADETMRRLLAGVDRKQTLWLAVTPPRLGKPLKLTNDRGTQGLLNDVLGQTTGIQGGMSWGRDLRLHFVLEGRSEAGLRGLMRKLEALKKQAQSWLFNHPSAPRAQRLWFLMFARAQTTLRGRTLEVQSLVVPAQLS